MTEQELINLKKRVDEAKTTVSELKGQYNAGISQLKEEWDQSSIEGAQKQLDLLEKAIDKIEANIEKQTEELGSKYDLS